MPNHFHLLVEVGASALAKAMQVLLYRYTRYYNRRYRKVGHLFQGRYKAILCDRESYLLELIRYIHLNPVRSGMVSDPTRYAWSSHGVYMRGQAEKGVAVDKVLPLFSARRSEAIKRYEEFVLDGLSQGHRKEYYEVKEQRYLGDETFVENVELKLDRGREEIGPVKITIKEVLDEVARLSGVEVGGVLGKGRGRIHSLLRAQTAYVAREVGGISMTQAATYLQRDLSTVSLAVKKIEERMLTDIRLHKDLEHLCAVLRTGRKRQYQINKA